MGFESRDYFRDGSYTRSLAAWGVAFTPAVRYLLIANVAVFLLQIFFTRSTLPDIPGFDTQLKQRGIPPEADDEMDAAAEPGRVDPKQQEEIARKARDRMERLTHHLPSMRVSVVQEWFELSPHKTVEQGQVWRLVTCAFCHDRYNLWHIFFNMLALYWFGTRLERRYGPREFLLFYLAAAVCSSLAFIGLAYHTGSNVPAIGASGAVMGVMMLYTIFYPFETFLIFWMLPVPLWVLLGVYVLYDLHPVLLQLSGDPVFTGVAHAGHLGGLAFGFVYWRFGLRLETALDRVFPGVRRRQWRAPVVLAHPAMDESPQRDELADHLDDILRKISTHGTDSLTEAERDLLLNASARYRGRRRP